MGLYFAIQLIDPMKISPTVRYYFFSFFLFLVRISSRSVLRIQSSSALPSGAVLSLCCSHPAGDFSLMLFFFSFFPTFWPRSVACGVLVPRPGIEPEPPALEVGSLNPWTAREGPGPCPEDDPPSRPVPHSHSWTQGASSGRNLLAPSGMLPARLSLWGCSPPSSGPLGGTQMPALCGHCFPWIFDSGL